MPQPLDALDFLEIEALLSAEEIELRDRVRGFVRQQILPEVEDWFERGAFPSELAPEFGKLGLLGMGLEGYGCPGGSEVDYGLACLEIEAGDSGLRSFMSVQGSLVMFAIHRFGSEEQREEWLPSLASGEAIGCYALTEPESGSDPGSMTTFARRERGDWILNGRKRWNTNGLVSDVAIIWARTEEGIRGFVVPADTPGLAFFSIDRSYSLRPSARGGGAAGGHGASGAADVPERSEIRDRLGCSRSGAGVLRERPRTREEPRAVRQADRRVPAHAAKARRDGAPAQHRRPPRRASGPDEGRGTGTGGADQHGQAQQRSGCPRCGAGGANDPRRERRHRRLSGHAAHGQPRVRHHLRGNRGGPH